MGKVGFAVEDSSTSQSFLARNEFLIRRLFSLCGLVPVGAYMVVHLLTNSSLVGGWAPFQRAVYGIHSLGPALPVVEWVFIFLPILFHAILGVVIIRGGTGARADVAALVAWWIVGAYWFTSSTSIANPAVGFGRMFSDSFAGISPSSWPMFAVMQVCGGACAVILVRSLFGRE